MSKCLSGIRRCRPASVRAHLWTLASLLFIVAMTVSCGKFFPDANSLVAISVTPSNASLQLTKTQQFTAIGSFGDGTSKDVSSTVTWSSSSSNVASINNAGLATALQTGTTTITASQSGQSGSTTLTVTTGGGGGLTILCAVGCTSSSGTTFTASAGSTLTFQAQDSSRQTVTGATWTSSNSNIPIGANTGIITNASAGTTTITATANGITGTGTLTVQ
jgi:uncharacterized protein YjdB